MRYGILPWALLAMSLAGCREGESAGTASDPNPPPQSDQTDPKLGGTIPVAFWKEFQDALRTRDADKIAGMTSFPADIGLAGIEEFEGINQREGFIRHFDTIFPEEAVATLLAMSASSWEMERPEESGRTGHHWSVSYHNKPAMSEGEFGIYYIFSPMPDGSVRLTAVDFVG